MHTHTHMKTGNMQKFSFQDTFLSTFLHALFDLEWLIYVFCVTVCLIIESCNT